MKYVVILIYGELYKKKQLFFPQLLYYIWVNKRCVCNDTNYLCTYLLDAVTLSGILKAKQKLGRTFNSNKLGGIVFTKISKLTMCSA